MKLLLDANISWKLCDRLKQSFEDCRHVDKIGLSVPAKDIEIWNYALANDLIIVTNDDDFLNLSGIKGFPPKVILLRTGNQRTSYLETVLLTHIADIEMLYHSSEIGLLQIY